VKVFNTDFVLQRFLLAIGIELANLISSTKRTTIKAGCKALLALRIEAQRHSSNANVLDLQCPHETVTLSESSAKLL
jgi:hypothetical protein